MTILSLIKDTFLPALNQNQEVGVLINDVFHPIQKVTYQEIEVHPYKKKILGEKQSVIILGHFYSNKDDNYKEFP